ncbi:EF-hand domain-containing protein [Acidovorax sp. SUPP2522]|uniref:EF-hand domain-containing protein n=1 Tax=unclassified Acidovorax TaxID=2684926 RepID=UPI002349CC29|nr:MULTISPECIES: EF-hand domain-containing protein [unclassified Acidovorax]WCM97757.1 EF-hand domain-containing protein [Acidovorax sp. GBBC 1281]GKT13386.1 EF-hand domain-containing protein [Acidovorax sp. SUPP2522]
MAAQQRRTLPFDSRSVMLFAAITLGGAAVHAQTPSPTLTSPSNQPPQTASGTSMGLHPGAKGATFGGAQPAAQTSSAFDRVDTDKNGQLTLAEAARLPAIGNRFKELDKDHNGALSRSEFEAGAHS